MPLRLQRHNLFRPGQDRLYVFEQNMNGTLTVRKWERELLVEAKTLYREEARGLWRHLVRRVGYKRV